MSSQILSLIVPGTDQADGPALNVSSIGGEKTVEISGRYDGQYLIMGSHDGILYAPLLTFNSGAGTQALKQTADVVVQFMKVRRQANNLSSVTVSIAGTLIVNPSSFITLATIPGGTNVGPLPSVDLWTVVGGTGFDNGFSIMCRGSFIGQIAIEGSLDGVQFSPLDSFSVSPAPNSQNSVVSLSPIVLKKIVRYVRPFVQTQTNVFDFVSITIGGSGNSNNPGPNLTPTPLQMVTDFWINTVSGDDNAEGLTDTTPFKTIARWRQLIWGARYGSPGFPSIITIHAIGGSLNTDDGLFYGFTTTGPTARVVVLTTTTVIGGGVLTIGTTAGYVGNARAQVVDSALPVSWTDSYGVTTAASSRYIVRVGGAGPCIAPLILDQGSKTAMIGLATTTSETSSGFPTAVITNFSVGDTYNVETRPAWPSLLSLNCKVRLQCFDVFPALFNSTWAIFDQYSLCGFTTNGITSTHLPPSGQLQYFNCIFAGGVSAQEGNWVPIACAFKAGLLENGAPDWASTENVFLGNGTLGAAIKIQAGGVLGSGIGTLRIFDSPGPLAIVVDGCRMTIGSVVGSGNTGSLVSTATGGVVFNASGITATTSKALPYTAAGIDYAIPTFDPIKGTGSYA